VIVPIWLVETLKKRR